MAAAATHDSIDQVPSVNKVVRRRRLTTLTSKIVTCDSWMVVLDCDLADEQDGGPEKTCSRTPTRWGSVSTDAGSIASDHADPGSLYADEPSELFVADRHQGSRRLTKPLRLSLSAGGDGETRSAE